MTMSKSWLPSYIDSRITRRRFLKAGAAGAGAAALLACGGGGGDGGGLELATSSREPGGVWFAREDWNLPDETNEAVRGGIYRGYMIEDQEGHFDAITLPSSQAPISSHVHEMLMAQTKGPGIDPFSLDGGQAPRPVLAESMEVAADGSSITFTLRPGVKWHPVEPVNSRVMDIDDWKTSFERHLELSPHRKSIADFLDKVEYPDDRTMVWKTNIPYGPIYGRIHSDKFAYPILPKELNANPGLAEAAAIGTGYKILDDYQPSIAAKYVKNAQYWGGNPFIEGWEAPIIPEYANRYAQFITGNIIDFTPTSRDVIQMSKDAPGAVVVGNDISITRATRIRFGRQNHKTLPWKDPRVRIAIRQSIDFPTIGKFLSNQVEFERAGIPIELAPMTHLPRDPAYWLDPEKGEFGGGLDANYLYDVANAKKLIEAAGNTAPIQVDYRVLPTGSEVNEDDQLVTDSLHGSGNFEVNITRSLNSVHHRECRSLGECDGLVDSGTSQDADFFIYRDYHSEGNTSGEQAFPSPDIDRVAEAQRFELDPASRNEFLKEFQRVVAGLFPTVPHAHQFTTFRVRHPWVHNLARGDDGASGLTDGRPFWGGHLQWLDEAMPRREQGPT